MAIAPLIWRLVGSPTDVEVTAFDGSTAGQGAVRLGIRTPRALAYVARSPSTLGLGRAYVAGDLDIDGDPYACLQTLIGPQLRRLSWSDRSQLLRTLGRHALQPAPRPAEEARLSGRRHSRRRDAAAISHHYDVSNQFYEYVLGPSMAYTCAVYPEPGSGLDEAQEHKFDLVARKLGLQPGMRLLDVGCGWGGMVLHAASRYGVRALGVTLSRQQAEWAQKAIADAGLSDVAEVRHGDYRDVTESGFDAISSIGLTEHIGRAQLPRYFALLHSRLRPGGRLLNHCIMRPTTREPGILRRGFINRFVFPDGELEALGVVVSAMQNAGFEVRHEENLREHYARTLSHWSANLERHWDAAAREVGPAKARVWRIYLAGSRLGFERRQIELHQVLGVRVADGRSFMPWRPDWGV
jgi:cyclopropane-fatty-acyl-phospholipid synthase